MTDTKVSKVYSASIFTAEVNALKLQHALEEVTRQVNLRLIGEGQ
jgi:hypothetical protein